MIATTLFSDAIRIAAAILLDTLALVIWDLGTRPPGVLFADVARGIRDAGSIARAVVRVVAGLCAMVVGVLISAPVAVRALDFTIIECGALVCALVVEALVGPDLRARGKTPTP